MTVNWLMPNQKARELAAEVQKLANSLEGEARIIGSLSVVSIERIDNYNAKVQELKKTYKRFVKALKDLGIS